MSLEAIGPGLVEMEDDYDLEAMIGKSNKPTPTSDFDFRGELIREQTRSDFRTRYTNYKNAKSNTFRIFNEEFDMDVFPDSLILLLARTGHGKSTFFNHTAAKAIMEGRKVLICSNELNIIEYEAQISELIARRRGITDIVEVYEAIKKQLVIYDQKTSDNMTKYWDKAATWILQMIEHHKPDLVIFDQLTNADATADQGKRKSENIQGQNKEIKFVTSKFQAAIFAKNGLPPIIIAQQGYAPNLRTNPENWDLHSASRYGLGTNEDCTHVIILGSDFEKGRTYIKIDKARGVDRHKRVQGFKYDKCLQRFESFDVNSCEDNPWGKRK